MYKQKVKSAIEEFKSGKTPKNYAVARAWYVIDDSGELYPAKAIWALATTGKTKDMHTNDARKGLGDLGFTVVKLSTPAIDFEKEVSKSRKLSKNERDLQLRNAPAMPTSSVRAIRVFNRNPNVVASVLERANGRCEQCGINAPFLRAADGSPYLEVHHKIQLADGGEDTVANACAVCPNCHRELHFGKR